MEAFAPWAEPALMTAEQLLHLPEDGWLYELVDGRLVRMPPPGARHGRIAMALLLAVGEFVEERNLGLVFASETGFLISFAHRPDTVLAPDLAFVRADRAQATDVTGYPRLAPDLVAEVVSPSQGRREMQAKAEQWLDGGVKLVWLLFPETRTVEVWGAGEPIRVLSDRDELRGDDVLPGFVQPVARLFP